MKAATKRNIPQHRTEPTALQFRAIEMMLTGTKEADIADELKIDRVTVWRWRKLDPCFIAALNRRRAELWADHSDKLRALVAQALEVASAELGNEANPERGKLAVAVLKTVALAAPRDETNPLRIASKITSEQWENETGFQTDWHHQKWAELEALADEPLPTPPADQP